MNRHNSSLPAKHGDTTKTFLELSLLLTLTPFGPLCPHAPLAPRSPCKPLKLSQTVNHSMLQGVMTLEKSSLGGTI